MKEQWNNATAFERVMMVINALLGLVLLVFIVLQLTGVRTDANDVTLPLLGALSLVSAAQNWRNQRRTAVLLLCSGLFVLACSLAVLLLNLLGS